MYVDGPLDESAWKKKRGFKLIMAVLFSHIEMQVCIKQLLDSQVTSTAQVSAPESGGSVDL